MATKIDVTQEYEATPQQVRAMLCDEAYCRTRAERTGATSVDVTISGDPSSAAHLEIVRVLPADVPSFAKSFVGDTLTITEVQDWSAPAADGTGDATITAAFSAPMAFTGTMSIEVSGAGTQVRTQGEIKASVPLVGGKVEGIAKDTMERYLHKEQKIATEWLAAN